MILLFPWKQNPPKQDKLQTLTLPHRILPKSAIFFVLLHTRFERSVHAVNGSKYKQYRKHILYDQKKEKKTKPKTETKTRTTAEDGLLFKE